MDKKRFATMVMGYKDRAQWDYVLAGTRNLSFKRAKKAAAIFGTNTDIWQDQAFALDRQAAWKKFAESN